MKAGRSVTCAIISIFFLLLLFYAHHKIIYPEDSESRESELTPHAFESPTIVVNPNPLRGRVLFYDINGKLQIEGETQRQYELIPGRYTIKVIADEHFFTVWQAEVQKDITVGRNYVISPEQKKMTKWPNIFIVLLMSIFVIGGVTASAVLRHIGHLKKALASRQVSDIAPGKKDKAAEASPARAVPKCWELNKCLLNVRTDCEGYKKNLNCWDLDSSPCCRKDRVQCIICPSYLVRFERREKDEREMGREFVLGKSETGLLEKLSNPQMAQFREVSLALSSKSKAEDIGSVFLEKMGEAVPCENGALFLVDAKKENLRLLATHNCDDIFNRQKNIEISPAMHNWCAHNKFPMIVKRASVDTLWRRLFLKEQNEIIVENFEIVHPILDEKKKILGLIFLGKKKNNTFYKTDDFNFVTLAAVMANISLQKAMTLHLAIYDGLTNLFVIRHFRERIEEEIQQLEENQKKLSLIMIDIDYFKKFNDTYGHQQGDTVLREVAGILRRNIRTQDIPARYGGEELSVLFPDTDKRTAHELAERIRKAIESSEFPGLPANVRVTISIGIASCPLDAANVEELFKKADTALYRAKHEGRNRSCCA